MGDRRKFPVLLFAVAAGVLFVLAVFLAFFVSMRKDSNEEMCRANLSILYLAIRSGELPNSTKWDGVGTGRDFFRNRDQWPTYQHRDVDLFCPVKATRKDIDYRGPSRPLRLLKNDEPIAADRIGNHGPEKGGNVLLKTGQVYTVPKSDPLWSVAAQTTSD